MIIEDTICEDCEYRWKKRKQIIKNRKVKWDRRCPKCRKYHCVSLTKEDFYKFKMLESFQWLTGSRSKLAEEYRGMIRAYAEDGAKILFNIPGPLGLLSPSHPRSQKESRVHIDKPEPEPEPEPKAQDRWIDQEHRFEIVRPSDQEKEPGPQYPACFGDRYKYSYIHECFEICNYTDQCRDKIKSRK